MDRTIAHEIDAIEATVEHETGAPIGRARHSLKRLILECARAPGAGFAAIMLLVILWSTVAVVLQVFGVRGSFWVVIPAILFTVLVVILFLYVTQQPTRQWRALREGLSRIRGLVDCGDESIQLGSEDCARLSRLLEWVTD